MNLFSGTIESLENSLNYSNKKNQVISNNIANVDTPGFKSQNVQFKDVLKNEVNTNLTANKTNLLHKDFTAKDSNKFAITSSQNTTYNNNKNNVDIDKEMTELAKNQIQYQGLVERINGKFNNIQAVLRGGS